jgi:hypothetical protein
LSHGLGDEESAAGHLFQRSDEESTAAGISRNVFRPKPRTRGSIFILPLYPAQIPILWILSLYVFTLGHSRHLGRLLCQRVFLTS